MANLLELTSDLVTAQIQQGNIDHPSIDHWLRRTHTTLLSLWQNEIAPPADQPAPSVPVNWRHSIQQANITCLECGKAFRQLVPMHLEKHGLTAPSYRRKCGMPPRQPLSAREVTRRRREVAAATKPWEKVTSRRGRKARGE